MAAVEKILKIPENDVPLLREYYLLRLEEKKREVASIEAILSQLDSEHLYISTTNPVLSTSGSVVRATSINGYNPNWTWQQKISYFLSKEDLTTTQIVAKVLENEPDKVVERGKVVASVSATLSTKSKTEKDPYNKRLNERNEFLYSLTKKIAPDYQEQAQVTLGLEQ